MMDSGCPFHIDTRPFSITFTCPYCGARATIPWKLLAVPNYWGDDWGEVHCPDCKNSVKLGEFEYD